MITMAGYEWRVYDTFKNWAEDTLKEGKRLKASKIWKLADKFYRKHAKES